MVAGQSQSKRLLCAVHFLVASRKRKEVAESPPRLRGSAIISLNLPAALPLGCTPLPPPQLAIGEADRKKRDPGRAGRWPVAAWPNRSNPAIRRSRGGLPVAYLPSRLARSGRSRCLAPP
jgi:hypothetical protein